MQNCYNTGTRVPREKQYDQDERLTSKHIQTLQFVQEVVNENKVLKSRIEELEVSLLVEWVTGRFGPIPVQIPGRFGPIPFRSGRFGRILGVGRFGPTLAGRFGPLYLIWTFKC